jgi:hypothetical protein
MTTSPTSRRSFISAALAGIASTAAVAAAPIAAKATAAATDKPPQTAWQKWQNRSEEEIAERHRAVVGDANVKLRLILGSLAALSTQIDAWLDDHGAECECSFCQHAEHYDAGATIEEDLRGVQWAIQSASSMISGSTFPLRDSDLESLHLTRESVSDLWDIRCSNEHGE